MSLLLDEFETNTQIVDECDELGESTPLRRIIDDQYQQSCSAEYEVKPIV